VIALALHFDQTSSPAARWWWIDEVDPSAPTVVVPQVDLALHLRKPRLTEYLRESRLETGSWRDIPGATIVEQGTQQPDTSHTRGRDLVEDATNRRTREQPFGPHAIERALSASRMEAAAEL
jgi:hypothetical protein